MADPALKLPPGATLESPAQPSMKLPPGAELEGLPSQGPPSQGPPSGFLQGAYDSVAGGAKALYHSFVDKPTDGTLLDKTIDAQTAEGSKAVDNAKQGRYSEAAGHGLAAVLPGFGPAAAKAGEDIGSGNTGYGLGEAAGLIGTAAAPGIAEKIPAGRIANTVGKVGRGVVDDLPVVRQAGKIADYWKSTAPPATYPGAPEPATPPAELSQAAALYRGSSSPPDPSAGLGKIPARGSIAGSMADSMKKPEPAFKVNPGQLQDQLNKAVGAAPPPDPKAPIYQRGQVAQQMSKPAPTPDVPSSDLLPGHTPVKSSALKSYAYDPDRQEFEAAFNHEGSAPHRYGGVSPEQAQYFQDSPSQGKAFQAIKSSGTPLAKYVNGQWVEIKPQRGAISQQMQTR